MKKFKIKLGDKSIDEVIESLNEYKSNLNRKSEEIAKRVAETIKEDAQWRFDNAISDMLLSGYEREADVSVTTQKSDKGYQVVATGEEVTFIEFGAGVYANGSAGSSPHPLGSKLGMTIGGYGSGKGKQNTWGFNEFGELKLTHGTPASMPMYKSASDVKYDIGDIAREVFKND